MDAEEVKAMLEELDKSSSTIVLRALRAVAPSETMDSFATDECHQCGEPLEGEVYAWFQPLGSTLSKVKASGHGVMNLVCNEECLDAAALEWFDSLDLEGDATAEFIIAHYTNA